jgi:hypothetical protein
LPVDERGADRAPSRRGLRIVGLFMLATSLAVGGLAFGPVPTEAAQKKVVIVVGPVGGSTGYFKRVADDVAADARRYGAQVIKIYSPSATWARVKSAARGANVFVYLGHGNGWPSPYRPFQTRTKNGVGLNSSAGRSNSNHKYYGERFVASDLNLAKNAVVLLMRLCYAAGNSEPGKKLPSQSEAVQRVDNYGAGFLRAGASAVFAEGYGNSRYIFHGLWKTNKPLSEIYWSSPRAKRKWRVNFNSRRTRGADGILDPHRPRYYYRSVVGDLDFTATAWR